MDMKTERVRVLTLRDDQYEFVKELARYVRDECSKRMGETVGRPTAIDCFALRRTKDRIDELLALFDVTTSQPAGNGGKPKTSASPVTQASLDSSTLE